MALTLTITFLAIAVSVGYKGAEVVLAKHKVKHTAIIMGKLGSGKNSASPPSPNVSYAINHAIFSEDGLALYTTGQWADYVHTQDSFMLMSGNHEGKIDTDVLNQWARDLRDRHPSVQIYAATSGLDNVRSAEGLNLDLFTGLVMVYEPGFPNAPEFTWDQQRTEEIWREAAGIIRSRGLKALAKPSGRALQGRKEVGRGTTGSWLLSWTA